MEICARLIYVNRKTSRPARHYARDVTERKHAEAEREKLEDLNRQLQKSESLGRMAGAIAHHFNNQLLSVMLEFGNGESPRICPKDSKAIECLSDALLSARKAAEVSTLMLTYLGQSPARHEWLDLSAICQRQLPQLISALPHARDALASELSESGPYASAPTPDRSNKS